MAKARKRTWKNKDGKKTTCWFIDFIDSSGERVRASGFSTKVEAEAEMYRLINAPKNNNSRQENENLTLVEACNVYIELHAEIHCKKTTFDGYKAYLRNHVKPFFKNSKIRDITKIRVEQFIKTKIDSGLSNASVNHLIAFLKAVFQKMFDDEVIETNPLSKVKKLRVTHKNFEILDCQEVEKLLSTAKKYYPDYYPLLFTAIFTGLRQGELFALRWDKIDWANNRIVVDANYTKRHLTTPKSNKNRNVDMSKELAKTLREWKLKCPYSDKELVFPNKEGCYLDPSNMHKRFFTPLLRKARIRSIRFHDLRHTYASLLIANNIPIKYIQSQMGHASIQMTMDTYGHILPEVTQQGVNALDSLFKAKNEEKMAVNL